MRHKLLLAALVLVFLALAGFRFGGVPFIPGAHYSDALTAHWSAAAFTRESVRDGVFPLWRDTIFYNAPFAANPLNKTAYLLQWLVLILPPAAHLNALILLHLALAAAGMWTWARASGQRVEAAGLAALAYALAPRLIAHLGAGHLDIVYAMAWLPWLMWLLGADAMRAAVRIPALALVAGMLVLADVRVSLFAVLLGGAYLVWRAVSARDGRRVLAAAGAVLPFALLVAGMLVPLVSWQPYLSRAALTVQEAGTQSVEPFGLAGLLLPPHEGGGQETMVYLGVPVLVLALIGLFTLPRSHRLFWGGVLIVAALWALGVHTPFWRTLALFEPLRWFRVPGRAWLVVVTVAALLAGCGLQTLMRVAEQWREGDPPKSVFWMRLGAAGAAGLFAVCGLSLLTTSMLEMPRSAGALMVFEGAGVGTVLLVVLLRRGREQAVVLAFIALVFADVAVTGVQWLEWRGEDAWLTPYAGLAAYLHDDGAARVYSPSYALPQEAAQAYDLRLFYGVDPFQLAAFVDVMAEASGVPAEGYSITQPPLTGIETDEDIPYANQGITPNVETLAAWGVSHVIAAYEIDAEGLALAETVNGVNVYRNALYDPDVIPPALLPPEVVAWLDRVTVRWAAVSAVSFAVVVAWLIVAVMWRGKARG